MVHSRDALIPGGDLSALIDRLEAAEVGPDLDASICVLFQYGGPNSDGATNVRTDGDWNGDLLFEQGDDECCNPIPAVTTSLDAALALAERVLPGWNWCVARDAGASEAARFRAWVQSEEGRQANPLGLSSDAAASAALALCISILRAIQHGYEAAGEVSPNLKAKAQGEGGHG